MLIPSKNGVCISLRKQSVFLVSAMHSALPVGEAIELRADFARGLPAGVNGLLPWPAIRHDKPVTQMFASSALFATKSNET